MAIMTEEEAWDLEEKWDENPPDVGPNGTGFFAKRRAANGTEAHLFTVDNVTAQYILAKALSVHSTPEKVIRDMVRREMTNV
jgi:hypothetical protein